MRDSSINPNMILAKLNRAVVLGLVTPVGCQGLLLHGYHSATNLSEAARQHLGYCQLTDQYIILILESKIEFFMASTASNLARRWIMAETNSTRTHLDHTNIYKTKSMSDSVRMQSEIAELYWHRNQPENKWIHWLRHLCTTLQTWVNTVVKQLNNTQTIYRQFTERDEMGACRSSLIG